MRETAAEPSRIFAEAGACIFRTEAGMSKTRECIGCGNLTDDPGEILCKRCRIGTSAPPKKWKLLVIDDSVDILKKLKKALEATLFYNVITAYDGRKALEKLEYEVPDLIVVDVLMPMMNGYELVGHVRTSKNEKIRKLPVVVISDYNKMRNFFHPWDIQGFVTKPVNLRELAVAIHSVLGPPV